MTGIQEVVHGRRYVEAGARPVTEPFTVRSILIVGPTCAGKTTLGRALQASELGRSGSVSLAVRLLTRPPRQDDNRDECEHVSERQLTELAKKGEVGIYWRRPLADGSSQGYGCRTVLRGVPIYLGGHGLYDNASSVEPAEILATSLFVGVLAPPNLRKRRLLKRLDVLGASLNPNLERTLDFDETRMVDHVHLVIKNVASQGEVMREAIGTIQQLLQAYGRP